MNYSLPAGLPTCWAICECCDGNGHVENPSFSNGFTSSEFFELFDDEESREAYFNGVYDVVCNDCEGVGKVRVLDSRSKLTFSQKRILVEYRREQKNNSYYDEIHRAEIAYGA